MGPQRRQCGWQRLQERGAADGDSPGRNILLDMRRPRLYPSDLPGRADGETGMYADSDIPGSWPEADLRHADLGVLQRLQGAFPLPLVFHDSAYNSLLLGVTAEEAYSRFPMPFAGGAAVTIQNRSGTRIDKLRLRVDVERITRLPPNWGRFHATWTESPAATDKSPVTGPQHVPVKVVLEKQGRGKYVGVMLTVDWPYDGYWWGEGDWQIWTDESGWPPSYHGTGSEEYFNSGWGQFDRKAVSGFVTLRPGHPTVYCFHLNDAFQFQRNVRVVEEQMGFGPGEKVIRHVIPSGPARRIGMPTGRSPPVRIEPRRHRPLVARTIRQPSVSLTGEGGEVRHWYPKYASSPPIPNAKIRMIQGGVSSPAMFLPG